MGAIPGASTFLPLKDKCGTSTGICMGVQFPRGMNERGNRIIYFMIYAPACGLTVVS